MSYCYDILKRSKELHLDECEVVSIQKDIITVRITDSEIAETKHNREKSSAIRIIDKKKIISAKTTENEKDLLERALQARTFVRPMNLWNTLPFPSASATIERMYDSHLAEMSDTSAIDIAQEMINASNHKDVTRISGSLNIVSETYHIVNTNGMDCSDKSTFISGTINTESETGNSAVSGIGADCSRTKDRFSAQKIGHDALEMCVSSINPQKVESDTYQIIFDPYAFGDLLSFVFSVNFNLKTYSEKRSCFSGKFGEKISDDSLTIMDDPHAPDGIGSKPSDDEGVATKPQYLINSGVFSGLFSDSFEAFKNQKRSSANAARPGSPMGRSTQPSTVPQPHNLRVVDGKHSREEIIKDTKKGLLVGRLWYTYPINPEQGDFSCTARSGVKIIKDGKISSPGKSVRIVHNLKNILANITAIGNDSRNILQWHSLPSITPTISVSGIPVTPL
ncbi:MAG: TldD/PmbA family protein [Thaumarchaeota archaeon]|nr:TldD/PmbA family protein [Nitrososphaerota archaeon]